VKKWWCRLELSVNVGRLSGGKRPVLAFPAREERSDPSLLSNGGFSASSRYCTRADNFPTHIAKRPALLGIERRGRKPKTFARLLPFH
jgi:hypothetical protein